MPPVIVALAALTVVEVVTIGVAVVGGIASYSNAKKSQKKMEEEMKRQEALQAEIEKKLTTQQSEFYGGGGGASLREDTKLMLKSSKSPRNVVFGRDRVSGPMMPFFSYTQNNVLYHRFGVVLAGHECDAIETVYLNDEPVTLDVAGWVIAPAKFTDNGRSLFFIEKKLGGAAQTASQYLIDAAAYAGTPSAWGSDRKAIGVCYVVVHMEANYDVLHDIGLPNVSAVVRGVKAYDPRTMTTAWTRNPALLARWWLVDSVYSPLTVDADIDQAELIASANVCDEAVAFSASVTAQRYACDGALNTNANPLENLNKIMAAMDGDAVWVSGKWQLIAGYYKAPTLAINESHIAGGQIIISPYAPTAQIINAISGQFKGPDTKYQAAGYPMVSPPAYLAEDGGQLYERKDDFDLVNDPTRCQMIAWQRLSRARQQLAINMVCNLKAYNSSPLQTISLSLAEFGYSNKVFQVRKRVFSGFSVEYFLQETGAAVWNWNYANANAVVEIPNINVPVDLSIGVLQNVVIESGTNILLKNSDGTITSRMRVSWTVVQSYFVKNGGQIEWQYRTADVGSGAGPWLNAVKAAGNATSIYIDPVVDGVVYNLRGRAISQLGIRGDSTAVLSHTVIGKTEPPAGVTQFAIAGDVLTWLNPADVDFAGCELRFNYGNNQAWGTATALSAGLITDLPYTLVNRPSGPVTLLIKAIDTTGNYSLTPAVIVTDLGDAPVANIVEQIDFHPLFNGTKTGCTIIANHLVASFLDRFYGDDAQAFYDPALLPFYAANNYSQMVYVTNEVPISTALAGSLSTLDIDWLGSGMTIEYRRMSPDPMYGLGVDAFYDGNTAQFYSDNGPWLPWPGQVALNNSIYQWRVTIGSGAVQGVINSMSLVVDAPDIIEVINDLAVSSTGTTIPYTKPFNAIKNVQATLQANASGAITVEIDKTISTGPKVRCFNAAHTVVAGATVDLFLKGY